MKSTSGFRVLVTAVSQSGVSVFLTWSITDQWLACCLLSMAAEETTIVGKKEFTACEQFH